MPAKHRHQALYEIFYKRKRDPARRMPLEQFTSVVSALESGKGGFRQIAIKTGAKRYSVSRIADLAGIGSPNPKGRKIQQTKANAHPKEVTKGLMRLRAQGISIRDAAKKLGISSPTATKIERTIISQEERRKIEHITRSKKSMHPKRQIIIQLLRVTNQDREITEPQDIPSE